MGVQPSRTDAVARRAVMAHKENGRQHRHIATSGSPQKSLGPAQPSLLIFPSTIPGSKDQHARFPSIDLPQLGNSLAPGRAPKTTFGVAGRGRIALQRINRTPRAVPTAPKRNNPSEWVQEQSTAPGLWVALFAPSAKRRAHRRNSRFHGAIDDPARRGNPSCNAQRAHEALQFVP